jgi:hypothetical protein
VHESFGIIILLYMSFSLSPSHSPTPHLVTPPPNSHTTSPRHRYIHPPLQPPRIVLFSSPSFLFRLLGRALSSHTSPTISFLSPSHSLTLPPPQPLDRGFVHTSVCLYVLGAYVFEITELMMFYYQVVRPTLYHGGLYLSCHGLVMVVR